MAHIPDGLLSMPVVACGAVAAAALTALALRRVSDAAVVRAGVLGAVFFAVSLIAVPVGPSSVHLMMTGVMGLLLGRMALPTVLAALVLQLLLFGFGGVMTLGVNALVIAGPGMAVAAAMRPLVVRWPVARAAVLAGLGASVAVLGTGAAVAGVLALSHSAYVPAAGVMLATYVPLALVEGLATAAAIAYLRRAHDPQMLGWA